MSVYSVFVVSRGGSLIYDLDYNIPKTDVEKTFGYPLDITLKVFDEKLIVDFGARDGIKGIHICCKLFSMSDIYCALFL